MNIQDQLRLHHVTRWNIVATTKTQSVAEHTYNVQVIAVAFTKELGREDLLDSVRQHALEHDMEEAIEGDIPTPTKVKYSMRTVDMVGWSRAVLDIVKLADTMEAHWFICQYGANKHAMQVAQKLSYTLADMTTDMTDDWQEAYSTIRERIFNGAFSGI